MIILDHYHVDSFGELSEYNKGVVGEGGGEGRCFFVLFLLTAQVQWLDIFIADSVYRIYVVECSRGVCNKAFVRRLQTRSNTLLFEALS